MFYWSVDVLNELKYRGYSQSFILRNKLLPTSTLDKLRAGDTSLTLESLNKICNLLDCSPWDLLEWEKD